MTLEEAMATSSVRYAWAEWRGGKAFVGKLKYEDPYPVWEVRLHYEDGRRGGVWPTIAHENIPTILWRELRMDVFNCPSWQPYEPSVYLHPGNHPSIINSQ